MAEAGQIKIVLHRGGADHQIPHRQARIQAARHAGIDKRPHVEAIDQGLGAQGGADLADAAAESSRTREELALYERPDGDASGEEEE